ncbi:MAG: cobalt ECF transporter T component CbiQ [Chloroflexota bacterium]
MHSSLPMSVGSGRGLHGLDGRVKVPLALGVILTAALLPNRPGGAYLLLISALWAAALFSGEPLVRLIRRGWLALPFGLAALPLLFTTPGNSLLTLPAGNGLALTDAGLMRFSAVLLKAWISLQAAVLLTLTTSIPAILLALRALKVPRLLLMVIALMSRYLYVFGETARQMLQAREARSSQPDPHRRAGGSLWWRARVTGGMAGSLLIRSFERAERVYAAMLARGYDGELRSLPQPALSPASYRILASGGFFFLLVVAFGWLTTGGGR